MASATGPVDGVRFMRRFNRASLASKIDGLINEGAGAATTHSEERRIRTVNVVTVGCMVVSTAFACFYLLIGYEPLVPIVVANLLLNFGYAGVIWLNSRGRTKKALWVLLSTGWINTIVPAAILGVDTGVYLYLMLVPMVGVLLTGSGDRLMMFVMIFFGVLFFAGVPLLFTRTPGVVRDSWVEHSLFVFSTVGVGAFGSLFALYYRWLVDRAETRLAQAREISEGLLLNILPEPVAERLKMGESPIADRIDDVTVLFADLVGSTPLAEKVSADALVMFLDRLFSEFDDLADLHGLEKITTIGDGYLAVSGLPKPRADHMEAAASMALAMMEAVERCSAPGGSELEMRIGLASGSVVAGVIGRRKFRYDVWGDTVNTASRMESHSLPGAIHVTADIRQELEGRFEFRARGPVEIKGKGYLETFFLEGRAQVARDDDPSESDLPALIPT